VTSLVDAEGLFHIYRSGRQEVVALQGLDLRVDEGEAVAVVGRSGSGKTTLMNVLAAMERPSAGRVHVAGHDLARIAARERLDYQRRVVGYVWQDVQLNLSPELTAAENAELPMLAAGSAGNRRHRASELLEAFNLLGRAGHRPATLSTGEQQRLAVVVALANRPRLLLADEPTAELDRANARRLLADLRSRAAEEGTALILVTHDNEVAAYVDRVIAIRDGRTSSETRYGDGVPEELVIMDRAGRIQIPAAYVDALRLAGRVRVRQEGDTVVVKRWEARDGG
jgi:ABC-type lipoprotein export system ATPase subunit